MNTQTRNAVSYPQPWFLSPDFERSLQQANLSSSDAALARQFESEGFVILDLLTERDDAYFEAFIESLGSGYLAAIRLQDVWQINSFVRDLACNPRILEVLEALYGREPFPFQTLNFPRGTEQLTHSDMVHFDSVPHHFMCGVWVALQDVTLDDGLLHYYPGSHKLPVYTLADLGVIGSSDDGYEHHRSHYEPFIQQMVADLGLTRVDLEVRRGQALIWAANLLHGGNTILKNGSTRHTQVTHYYFKDCVYYTPMHSDPMLKKIYYRNPWNVLTGSYAESRYSGQAVPMTFKQRLGMWKKGLTGKFKELPR